MEQQDASKNLVETLKTAREKSGITYDDLAVSIGYTPDAVKNFFAGKVASNNFFMVCALFKKFGLSVDEFVEIPLHVDSRSAVDNTALLALLDVIKADGARIDEHHESQLAYMKQQHSEDICSVAAEKERQDKRNRRLVATIIILSLIVFALTLTHAALWIFDFLNPAVGWIRKQVADNFVTAAHKIFG